MNVEELTTLVVKACDLEKAQYMLTGAFAYGIYGISRSTKDVDVVLSVADSSLIGRVMERLSDKIEFGGQVQFDTADLG